MPVWNMNFVQYVYVDVNIQTGAAAFSPHYAPALSKMVKVCYFASISPSFAQFLRTTAVAAVGHMSFRRVRVTTKDPLLRAYACLCHASNTILSDYADLAVYYSQNFKSCNLGLTAAYGSLCAKSRSYVKDSFVC